MEKIQWRLICAGTGTVFVCAWLYRRRRRDASEQKELVIDTREHHKELPETEGSADLNLCSGQFLRACSNPDPRSQQVPDDPLSAPGLQRAKTCPPSMKYVVFQPDFDAPADSEQSPLQVAANFANQNIFGLELCGSPKVVPLSSPVLERFSSPVEWQDAWERMVESLPAIEEFNHQFDVDFEQHSIRIGQVFYDRPHASAAESAEELRRLGFTRIINFKSLAFRIGEERELIVCAVDGDRSADRKKVLLAHQSRMPQIPDHLRNTYQQLRDQAPSKPAKGVKPTEEEIEALKNHRAQMRGVLDEIRASLGRLGSHVSKHYIERQIRVLVDRQDYCSITKIELAPEADMTAQTGCIRGGLHPVRHCYSDPSVPVFVDEVAFQQRTSTAQHYRWAVVGGGTPTSVFFIPFSAFCDYAERALIVTDIIQNSGPALPTLQPSL